MPNDTSREIELAKVTPQGDPLGFDELKGAVARLVRLKAEEQKTSRWTICVEGLEKALEGATMKYELLRDRYALLKRSNSQLADEVAWLRDQCDDLFTDRVGDEQQSEANPEGVAARRYSDRFPR